MQLNKTISLFCLALACLAFGKPQNAEAQCSAKVDLGLAYVHLDNLLSGRTIHSADLAAIRADVNVRLFKGLIIKPTVLYGASAPFKVDSEDSLFAATIAVGHCIPFCNDKLILQPNVGWTYTRMKTVFNSSTTQFIPPIGPVEVNFSGVKQSFRSNGPAVGLEVYYSFTPCFRTCVAFQYIWSKTNSELQGQFSDSSHTQGPSYSAMLEYDINEWWSVNIAGAYNVSLTKEKHGLRAAGAKVGLARWF